jgi:hypothetical protein
LAGGAAQFLWTGGVSHHLRADLCRTRLYN